MADDKDWKSKYFDSLQQLEDKESTWNDLENLLRKAISRLAISAKGIDKRLDKVLKSIQTHSRNKKDHALESDLEELSSVLAKIDDQSADTAIISPDSAPAKSTTDSNFHEYLIQLLDRLNRQNQWRTELNALKQQLPALPLDQAIDQLADILSQGISPQQRQEKSSLQDVLLTLVEKIELSHGNSDRLSVIKERLDSEFNDQNWDNYLDDILAEIRVIIHGITDEKVELESLIVDVTRQLNEISDVLTDEHSANLIGRQETQRLQSMMDESVDNIQQSVDSISDIQLLKSSINDNLVNIRQGVEVFVRKDDQRFHQSEQRNQKLQQQIKLMEQESGQLKQKLNENRKKLLFDTLTGARSRLSYDELLNQELSRWARYQETFSFAILDIDHFKKINDQYGHNAGDKALQIVARMMASQIRKTDFLFRIGGEEFVLLLPKTSLEHAQPLVEKIRIAVGKAGFHFKQQKVQISLSAGLTAILSGDNAESIYERADAALYQAKNSGRDQLVAKAN